ncbi:unnamed protein product [Lasius platythorax]|uniref:Uncharacterized protein n=1 Tax=Lasius platythorax TaxID=488582 RepID=A0AAV2NWZ0_9HYME
MGFLPLVDSKLVRVLVYHRVCRATKPAVPLVATDAIENADNLIGLTLTIHSCPRFTKIVGEVDPPLAGGQVSRMFIGLLYVLYRTRDRIE